MLIFMFSYIKPCLRFFLVNFQQFSQRMARNNLMHERNIYRRVPDFTQLAIKFPEFLKVCSLDLNGTAHVDFKNPDTLRILTKCLLKQDFQLDVEIPPGKLVPTLPLRLNYILWIEDIMEKMGIAVPVGMDIGCGASCVYPLLAAKWKGWQMFGTDITDEIAKSARENVSRNQLEEKIHIIQQEENAPIFTEVLQNRESLHFCMCNPPFFDDTTTSPENRTGRRAAPRNAPTGNSTELACSGGEVAFIERILEESIKVSDRVSIFTTMIGIKHDLGVLVKKLRHKGITNYIETHFCQGNTTRWGLAWTFREDLLLRRVPCINPSPSDSNRKSVNFSLSNTSEESVRFIIEKLKRIFRDLEAAIEVLEESTSRVDWIVRAHTNTWSHQRRKRRQMLQNEPSATTSPERKKIRLDDKPILVAEVFLTPRDNQVKLELMYLNGELGRDGIHQVLQYIINNWRRTDQKTPVRTEEQNEEDLETISKQELGS
ncbi:U6 small nuclear RNA (adenine-(43)-N(6))-methyltransferase [Lutzomyia longipalpis]|uniref:U6 small nuclear RNA (adenine-(43)-N(6))-methyltransferase n=1 Tax=Lutzomyia longipalpis TaxID=7200 RepID=UPI0024845636|nr:U6 small nuclear RNA (adenine-(43)-N(6))-methyltransferase [Lutzomyia longipalpis]